MAEDDDQSSKTEQPTGHKLEQAREQGQLPLSRELNHWFAIGSGTLILLAFAPGIGNSLTDTLRAFIAKPDQVPADAASLTAVLSEAIMKSAYALAPAVIILLAGALSAGFLQTGFLFSWHPLVPKLSKLSPLAGLKRLFAVRTGVEFLKNLAKLGIVGSVAFFLLMPVLPNLDHLIVLEPVDIIAEFRRLALRLAFGIFVTITFIMIADIIYQRVSFTNKMRMTRQEVKEENKQQEGDPAIKMRIRQLRVQRARARMMANVPKADVIVTNPTHYAIALQYKPADMAAPIVIAKGQDLIAQKIREIATEHKIAIVENAPLARALYASVEIDEQIPAEHYKAVAEIISYVFKLRGRSTIH